LNPTFSSDQLEIAGHPDADVFALLAQRHLLLTPAPVADQLGRLVQAGFVVAGVPFAARAVMRQIGKLIGLHQVAAPQLDRIHVQLPRYSVHQPLDDVCGFWPSGAAIGIDRRGIGCHQIHFRVD
jgi:hypothetical protein